MFVSPPPTVSQQQLLPNVLTRRKSNDLATIPENPSGGSQDSLLSNVGSGNTKKEFVNAPPEFANRARDEIKKRLLQKRGGAGSSGNSGNHGSGVRSMHSFRNHGSSAVSSSQSSVYSGNTYNSDAASVVTGMTASSAAQSSIFSVPSFNTVSTQLTESSSVIDAYDAKQQQPLTITLEQALPTIFYDMYSPEILMNPQNLMSNGRPKFTKRELLDWDVNDIRSLLIIESLRPEWHGQLPTIAFQPLQADGSMEQEPYFPQFRFQLLPLNSPDKVIISTLVSSDLYIEANLDYEFKLTSAQYTVNSARRRHEEHIGYHEPVMHLSKPEWRNIIENYLLNIAVEAQCRFDFKKACSEYKKWKLEQLRQQAIQQKQSFVKKPNMPPPSTIPKKSKNSLLRRALLRNSQLKIEEQHELELQQQQQQMQQQQQANAVEIPTKVSLTKEEKSMVWSHCQLHVYQRLGLDWTPDNVSANKVATD